MFRKIAVLIIVLVTGLGVGCSSGGGGEAGSDGDGGERGIGGDGGSTGDGGSGGMSADCVLSDEWETTGSWGNESFAYGNVVLMQNPNDDSLWHSVSRVHMGTEEAIDVALFRSQDEGKSWIEMASWDFPGERRGWPSDAAMADDGTIYVVLREYTLAGGQPPATDRFVKLLRYVPGGDLIEVGSFNPEGSTDTRSNTIITRDNVPYFIAFDATPVPPDYHIVKYESGKLESVAIIRYGVETNEVYVRDLAVAPNGKIWTVGQGYDGMAAAWAATIWEEGDSGYALIAELYANPAVKESDTIMALAFDDDGRFWTSYYTMPYLPDLIRRWRAGYGMVDAPQSSFGLNDDFSLDATKASDTHEIALHPSGLVFAGGYAVDENDWQWGVVRKGTTSGFEPSDEFIHADDGTYRSDVSSILIDERKNVWVAYMSRPYSSWSPKLTTIRKLRCVR